MLDKAVKDGLLVLVQIVAIIMGIETVVITEG